MKKLIPIFLLLLLYGCTDDCEGIDCLNQESIYFTIRSANTGNDLLFGNDPQLSQDDIEVFYFMNGIQDTAITEYQTNLVLVHLNRDINEYYINAMEQTDTLSVRFFQREASGCCPATTEVDEIRLNGNPLNQDPWETIVLYR